jgi:hypothetical protein
MVFLPKGERRWYLRGRTCIAIVHELEKVPYKAPLRNDSIMNPIHELDIHRWRSLFGFTSSEAVSEIREFRSQSERREFYQSTMDMWPWVVYKEHGFDREAYEYWLGIFEDVGISNPKETAAAVRQEAGIYQLFVLLPQDYAFDRIAKFLPEYRRDGPIKEHQHEVYDFKGYKHHAIVLRA